MTKRRPSSCKSRWQVAACIVCGLLLLNVPSTVWAAGKKATPKAAVAKRAGKPARRAALPPPSSPEFGPADLIEDGTPGLRGHASFYGHGFQGRKTATGERFDVKQFTAASNRFPLGTMLAVRRVDNDRCAIVKVNDRMHARHRKRIIDVSRSVAEYLDMIRAGVVFVSVAPLKDGWQDRAAASCHAAFEPDAEPECPDCGQLPKLPAGLPEFLPGTGG